jgi:hypothetical protein
MSEAIEAFEQHFQEKFQYADCLPILWNMPSLDPSVGDIKVENDDKGNIGKDANTHEASRSQ